MVIPIPEKTGGELNSIVAIIKQNPGIQAKTIVKLVGRPQKTVEKQIQRLIAQSIIHRLGSKKTGGYHLL
ncbi:hypothetical protein [Runella sp.]|uniref:hypothetical protein n=1 Tax=Runella sp. TaxID=1960881 RepID=UPI0030186E9E